MLILSYEQVIDPNTPTWLMEIDDIATQKIVLTLVDEKVKMYAPDAILNMICWQIYVRFNIPIKTRHLIKRVPLNTGNLAKILTEIHNEVAFMYPDLEYERKESIFTTINNLYNFIVEELNAYVSTISARDLCEIITDPKIVDLKKRMNISIHQSTDVVEKKIAMASKELLEYLNTKGCLGNEALLSYQQAGMLNKFQIPQMFLAYGPRTDVDDVIIRYPVIECAIAGLDNIMSFAVESLSAKKSAFYNKVAVTDSQYTGRKQHILASTVSKIYQGDCGTTVTVKFLVNENNYKNILGKYIVENNQLVLLRYIDDIKPYIGKYIELRSPTVCKHRDGYCTICGGIITRNINKKLNVGILASIAVIEPTTQKILSAKHLVKTTSQIYEVPEEAAPYFSRISADRICWDNSLFSQLKYFELGVSNKDLTAGGLSDIKFLVNDKNLNEAKYSNLQSVVLRDTRTGNAVTIPLTINNQSPFFTREMLLYIRDNFNKINIDTAMIWIPLEGTDKFPILKSTVTNDNMMLFVKAVKHFLESNIDNYTSISAALRDFSDIVYSKVDNAALMHLEVLIKAYLITSNDDYRIPEVKDPENVRFQTLDNILSFRSIGQKFAYQCLNVYLGTPSAYLVPKGASEFDTFLGIISPKKETA